MADFAATSRAHEYTTPPLSPRRNKIWTTLVTNRAYLCGVLVLNHTLRKTESQYSLVVMITDQVTRDEDMMKTFLAAGIETVVVEKITPSPIEGVTDKGTTKTWEKLAPWGLTQYERIVMLDSDQIVRQNIDELMEMDLPDDWIAAAHACTCNPRQLPNYPKDWIPPTCGFSVADPETGLPAPLLSDSPHTQHLLNSGTVVLTPSRNKWRPLPYVYNALKTMRSCHRQLWKDDKVKVIHFILDKPWKKKRPGDRRKTLCGKDGGEPGVDERVEALDELWWKEFDDAGDSWLKEQKGEDRLRLWDEVVMPFVGAK